jgi:hypothetical protein
LPAESTTETSIVVTGAVAVFVLPAGAADFGFEAFDPPGEVGFEAGAEGGVCANPASAIETTTTAMKAPVETRVASLRSLESGRWPHGCQSGSPRVVLGRWALDRLSIVTRPRSTTIDALGIG